VILHAHLSPLAAVDSYHFSYQFYCFDAIPQKDMRAKIGPRDFIISIIFGFAQDRGKRSLESIRKSVNLQYKADEYNGQLPSLQRAGILYNVSCT